MANVKLVFSGAQEHECFQTTLVAYKNAAGGLYIAIEDTNSKNKWSGEQFIVLDRETAVRLSKELRRQIALMD